MLSAIAKFADDATGLEKILRFGQYGCRTMSALPFTTPDTKIVWLQVQGQFALSRRFFRLLKWHGCWSLAYETFENDKKTAPEKALRIAKWSFLGFYLFFEMFTITNAMNITRSHAAEVLQREALKMWLYAIASSIFLSLYQLFIGMPYSSQKQKPKQTSIRKASAENKESVPVQNVVDSAYSKIYIQLVIDCADVLIPGAILGWFPIDDVYVGLAGSLTSVLAGRDVWDRVQVVAT